MSQFKGKKKILIREAGTMKTFLKYLFCQVIVVIVVKPFDTALHQALHI